MVSIFSVDVEDWFHILNLSSNDPSKWDTLESRVERNFRTLLDLFRAHDARVTCFFLGWIAERFPHLVREAAADGHEIASHGYSHSLVYTQSPREFLEDVRRAKQTLEDVAGQRVIGYRAPGYSVTEKTPWFFEKVAEAGYRYDSSVFPTVRGHGGVYGAEAGPHAIPVKSTDSLIEFPISVAELCGARLCLFGGGYLRLFPWSLIRRAAKGVIGRGRPVNFYVHPREIDPDHPRLAMNPLRAFKSYVNLNTTYKKIQEILSEFPVTTFEHYLTRGPAKFGAAAATPKVRSTAAAS